MVQPAGSEGTSVVLLMVRDAYANYVVQTTLDVIPECEEKRFLMEELNAHSTELVSNLLTVSTSFLQRKYSYHFVKFCRKLIHSQSI